MAGADGAARSPGKSPTAFRTITEVAADLQVPQHVLRFWETKFPQVKPLKRGGGRRYYRPEDVATLQQIRHLLYADGYTIRGAQKLLREQPRGTTAAPATIAAPVPVAAATRPDRLAPAGRDPDPAVAVAMASPAAAEDPRWQEVRCVLAELEAIRRLLPNDPDPR